MPVPNELTPEEEAEFTQHGVAPAGTGREPTGEPNQPERLEAEAQPRNADGTFASPAQHSDREPAPAATPTPTPTPTPAEPSQAEAQPAAPAAEGDGTQPSAPPPGYVPHAALHESREREKQLRQQMALLTARTNALLMQQPQEVEDLPNLEQNPAEYMRMVGERVQEMEQQRAATVEEQRVFQGIEADEQAFASYTPDYDAASDHYVQSRARELGVFYQPHEIQRILIQESVQMAKTAWSRGMPVAQLIYQAAQARGYTPQGGGAPAPAPSPAPTPTPTPTPTAAAVVDAIGAGQQVSRSLSQGSGSGAATALNAEALLNMSDEEFERHLGLGSKGANARFAAVG